MALGLRNANNPLGIASVISAWEHDPIGRYRNMRWIEGSESETDDDGEGDTIDLQTTKNRDEYPSNMYVGVDDDDSDSIVDFTFNEDEDKDEERKIDYDVKEEVEGDYNEEQSEEYETEEEEQDESETEEEEEEESETEEEEEEESETEEDNVQRRHKRCRTMETHSPTFTLPAITAQDRVDVGTKGGQNKCVVCEEHPALSVLVPCGHANTCMLCLHTLFTQTSAQRKCPTCRATVSKVIRLFKD